MLNRTRTLIHGVAALTAVLFVLAVVPALLLHFAGNPVPQQLPSWDEVTGAFTRSDDGTNLMALLKVVGWLGWLVAAASILIETVAQLTKIRPPRIPIAGRTVAAVLALATITATSTVGGHAANAFETGTTHVGTKITATGAVHPTGHPSGSTARTHQTTHTVTHQAPLRVTVDPGDTLSKIADEQLGDPNAYPQLFGANHDVTQPDGRHLSDPDLIQPGWNLTIPGKHTTVTETVTDPRSGPGSHPAQQPTPQANPQTAPDASSPVPASGIVSPGAPGGGGAAASGATPTGTTPATPALATPAVPLPGVAVPGEAAAQVTQTASLSASTMRTVAGLGGLAAAAALALLGLKRARQSSRRRPGQRIALPTGTAAIAEAQLRTTADPLTAAHLDVALRTIAHHAHQQRQALPALRAARITADILELYLTDDDATLPAPFAADPDDAGTWTLNRANLDDLLGPDEAATIPAPYPTLVTLGHDEDDAHLLIHLEEISALAIHGDPETTHAVMTALAIELIGSEWADDVRITLAGVLPDLADALGSDRVNYVDELPEILTALEYSADVHAQAMTRAGVTNPVQARGSDLSPETWAPHLILTTRCLKDAEVERIGQLLHTVPRLAIAAITAAGPDTTDGTSGKSGTSDPNGTDLGEWTLQVTGDPTNAQAVLQPVGLAITPQRLAGADYDALIAAFRTADNDPVDGPEWTKNISGELNLADVPITVDDEVCIPDTIAAILDADRRHLETFIDQHTSLDTSSKQRDSAASEPAAVAEPTEHDADSEFVDELAPIHARTRPDGPMLRLLGNVHIENPQGKKPTRPHVAEKLLTYIALHPGSSTEQLDLAVWGPDAPKNSNGRSPIISATRHWFGHAEDGHPYLAHFPQTSDYRCADDLPCDWLIFRDLIGHDIAAADTGDLLAALHLVQGIPLTGAGGVFDRDAWVAPQRAEMTHAIADVAHEVATRATQAGNPRLASWAAAKGLSVDTSNEALWRDALRAAHQSGAPGIVDDTITRLRAALDPLENDLDDDTQALINQLRTTAVAAA